MNHEGQANYEKGRIGMLSDELREQLIKQFTAEVVEVRGNMNEVYYSCPGCGRPVSKGMDKCGCGQALSWKKIMSAETASGVKRAALEFDVPTDFTKGDCRKCPISYIGKSDGENVYECPLKMRADCRLEIL